MARAPSTSASGKKLSASSPPKSPQSPKSKAPKAKRFTRSLTRTLTFSRKHPSSPPSSPQQEGQVQHQEPVVQPQRVGQRIKAAISTKLAKLKRKTAKMNPSPPPVKGHGPLEEKVIIDLVSDAEEEAVEENIYDASPVPASPAGFPPQPSQSSMNLAGPFQPPYPPFRNYYDAPELAPVVQQDDQGLNRNNFWEDYILDDIDDDALMNEILSREDYLQLDQEAPAPASAPLNQDNAAFLESLDECIARISNLFPGICPDHVSDLYNTVSKSSELLIQYVLDKVEKGTPYPTLKDKQKTLKRKRVVDEDEELIKKYGAVDRVIAENNETRNFIAKILGSEFLHTPMTFVNATLDGTRHHLFPAYRVLEEAERTFDPQNPPYNKIKTARKPEKKYKDIEKLLTDLSNSNDLDKVEVLKELQASRKFREKAKAKLQAERDAELAEAANTAKAEAEGTMGECGCCFCDYPLNRMVHCDGEPFHWFCRDCARRNAEEEIGKSKYELVCMSTDQCTAKFALDQRAQFLDESTTVALERNETEANLRLAGIENLASCPFCPYAAEYPPVEIDREFRCEAPDCEKVSCRLCKLESHIPKSCEEHAKENGLSIRRQIEEAMSAAMIRKCNKCGTPFIKDEGCNKMTCTRNGCYNMQCYVCHKSCDYTHFDDPKRGGTIGSCPLFEMVDERHEADVSRAEKEALEKVLAEHPEYTQEDLKVKMSENVTKDDAARKASDPRAQFHAMHAVHGHLLGGALNQGPGGLNRG